MKKLLRTVFSSLFCALLLVAEPAHAGHPLIQVFFHGLEHAAHKQHGSSKPSRTPEENQCCRNCLYAFFCSSFVATCSNCPCLWAKCDCEEPYSWCRYPCIHNTCYVLSCGSCADGEYDERCNGNALDWTIGLALCPLTSIVLAGAMCLEDNDSANSSSIRPHHSDPELEDSFLHRQRVVRTAPDIMETLAGEFRAAGEILKNVPSDASSATKEAAKVAAEEVVRAAVRRPILVAKNGKERDAVRTRIIQALNTTSGKTKEVGLDAIATFEPVLAAIDAEEQFDERGAARSASGDNTPSAENALDAASLRRPLSSAQKPSDLPQMK